jgi:hypothetical protein
MTEKTEAPSCWLCGEASAFLRKLHDGFQGEYLVQPEYTCADCMPQADDGPTFDDLPKVGE